MARGRQGGRGGRGGAGAGRGRRRDPTSSGIEKYGADEVDEYLGLNDDDDNVSEAASSDGVAEEEVFAPEQEGWDDEDDDQGSGSFKKALKKKGKAAARAEDDEDMDDEEEEVSALKDAVASGSVGWTGADFYGGDNAGGDSSDGGSDEDLNFEEARRLEELRAKRLGGLAVSDPLALLLGGREAAAADEKGGDAPDADGTAAAPAANSAKFESVFEAAAEKGTVQRDLSQLSDAKKKSLLKKEAPELAPLLADFKAKLQELQELTPLVNKPEALRRLPKSGSQYVQAKASLLLSTLANLSFYVLLRAEGGDVRSHPVVSQLVWLKELVDKAAPMDAKLRPKLKKTLKALKKVEAAEAKAAAAAAAAKASAEAAADEAEAPVEEAAGGKATRKVSLKEKLDRLRAAAPPEPSGAGVAAGAAQRQQPRTEDLLRLPGRRRKGAADGRGAPADLEEADPLVGHWMPQSTLGAQLSSVRQYVSEGRSKKAASADQEVEARPRRARERAREEPLPDADVERERRRPDGIAAGGELFEDGEDEADPLVKEAKAAAKRKKEAKTARQAAWEAERIERQNVPEKELDGRRKTSKKILNNRGLVRQRKRDAGNARVTNRRKYETKVKKRRGAVQDMREGADDGATYAGEATGVRTHVKKSMRLG